MTSRVAAATADTFRELGRERRMLAEMDADILRTQIAIAEIPAPTGDERLRANWIADQFRGLGLGVEMDDAGNVVARAPGAYADAPVVVCAHLDTVFPPGTQLAVRYEGDRLIGPGICDNGRGLAVMLAIARVVQECGSAFARPLEFIATTGEEGTGDLRGAKFYLRNSATPFAVLALDGAGDERIINTALGSRRFRVTYRGPGGHSWAAYGTVNPVHAVARAASAIAGLRIAGAGRSALSVSRIGGGISVNAIPEDAWLDVDVRSTNDGTLLRFEREIRDIAAASAAQENHLRVPGTPTLTHDIAIIGDRPCGQTTEDAPLVVAAIEATRLVGRAPQLATASTDANAAIGAGVPAIAIGGGGRGGDAHSSHEWFDNTAGVAGAERALTIVATMARLAAD
jgi:tripeptide aminopeptidase